ncbi:hypothetical protein KSMBR1_2570 [Candidatus Kuenenia stuttgartiensis]|jgi:hypothetical protein|uniref:Uncharacterized protein n=1 Tax=Kuenenia stuttgartiensis TaxID=174633 RepID=A0A2C9CJV4_KUEST|nr:hypothetical protein KSMBR1_2570 [Candidatus Kuenenia stuttgartiensis]
MLLRGNEGRKNAKYNLMTNKNRDIFPQNKKLVTM